MIEADPYNIIEQRIRRTNADICAAAIQGTPLPPSLEKAYRMKCIDLKRRLQEIEEANDAARLRKVRLDRAIMKMRLNRAFLLDQLVKSQQLKVDESDKSSSPPPTPPDRPLRLKRPYNRRSSPPNGHHSSPPASASIPLQQNQVAPAAPAAPNIADASSPSGHGYLEPRAPHG